MIATINVIDMADCLNFSVRQIVSYPATPEGRKKAESTFNEWVQAAAEIPVDEEEMRDLLDEGKYEVGDGCIAIISSLG
jgi:hypothetical protein